MARCMRPVVLGVGDVGLAQYALTYCTTEANRASGIQPGRLQDTQRLPTSHFSPVEYSTSPRPSGGTTSWFVG
jgi:hypothetical protein